MVQFACAADRYVWCVCGEGVSALSPPPQPQHMHDCSGWRHTNGATYELKHPQSLQRRVQRSQVHVAGAQLVRFVSVCHVVHGHAHGLRSPARVSAQHTHQHGVVGVQGLGGPGAAGCDAGQKGLGACVDIHSLPHVYPTARTDLSFCVIPHVAANLGSGGPWLHGFSTGGSPQ